MFHILSNQMKVFDVLSFSLFFLGWGGSVKGEWFACFLFTFFPDFKQNLKVDYIFQDVWARESQILATLYFERSLLHFFYTHVFFADKTKFLIASFRLPLSSKINRKTFAVVWSRTWIGDSEVSVYWIFTSNPLRVWSVKRIYFM